MHSIQHSVKKALRRTLIAGVLLLPAGCKDFLDVNNNPNGPQSVTANLYLAPMIHWMFTSPQFDGRFVGVYTQQWQNANSPTVTPIYTTWGRMGYDPASDNGAQQWRDVYWSLGQNLVDMMTKAEAEQRWDLLGVGQVLKAWGWQSVTDLHGELIVKEAIDASKFTFNYDSQEYAYTEIQRLLNEAIKNLQRTDGAVDQAYLGRTDKLYGGDRAKWLKLAYGMLAINLNHYSNKASYKPADVIANVDKSFTSNADEALLTYTNLAADASDANFLGPARTNFTNLRQTQFIVNLLNGTATGVPDPRLSKMLSPSPDGQFRGTDINVSGYGALTATQQPNNLYGLPGAASTGTPGRYLFANQAKMPVVTYAELQFIKAEAAFRLGQFSTALQAYTNGVSSHIDFVNARNSENGITVGTITAAEKAAFLADPKIIPTNAANLTLTQIMVQKYIALAFWGHNELWMDMRRYHYTDLDPKTGAQVYPGFAPPTTIYADNGGKLVQRIRPRYNSEYVWNKAGLEPIGGNLADYQTKPLWITLP